MEQWNLYYFLYHFLICFYHHKYNPIFSSITKKKKNTTYLSLSLSLVRGISLLGMYHIFTKNSTRFRTIVSCLSDTLVVCACVCFLFKDRSGRVGPKIDPNPRQTQILDPNLTQASIQPIQDPSNQVGSVRLTGFIVVQK